MSRWAATSARDWGRYFSTQGEALMSGGVPETMTFFPLSFGFKFWFSSSSKSISDTVSASAILFAGLALSCSLSLSLSLSHPPFAARFTVEGTLTATAGSVEAWAVFFFLGCVTAPMPNQVLRADRAAIFGFPKPGRIKELENCPCF